jgi:WD40 repeat protein
MMYELYIAADGATLVGGTGWAGGGGGSLAWFDAETLQLSGRRIDRIHEGSPKSFAMSPSGALMATGASDGYVRVWDVERRVLVLELRIGAEQAQGVAFVDETHLAVAPEGGHILIYSIDPSALIETVQHSLVRGFTEFECERFNFGDDCPTLAELRGDPPPG